MECLANQPSKVLKCAQCVKCAFEGYSVEKVPARACICMDLPVRIVNLKKTKKQLLRCLIWAGRPELVFFLVFKTSVGTLDEVGYGDCHHVCDDAESHHEDFDEGDHVHEDRGDRSSTSSSEDCLVMFFFSLVAQAGTFWKLVPEDVIETPTEITNADC